MKLSKLYSNNYKFKEVQFNDGLNVVLGKILDPENLDSDSHNLGKSTLIYLLDFMLLKELKDGHFLKDNYDKFRNYEFYLEIKLDESSFVTIKRNVKQSTKISFKLHKEQYQDFRYESNWDYKNLPLTTEHQDRNPKTILNNLIGFTKLPYNYRAYVGYFLRTQYDYDEVFKLSKFRGPDILWKPHIAYLLGFNGLLLSTKYEIEIEIRNQQKLVEDMEAELKVSLTDLNQIQSLIDVNIEKRDSLKSKIDSFDFYLNERELNKELIENIETEISNLNSQEYKLKYEIETIKESFQQKVTFDLDGIKKIFEEIKIYFPDQLKKEYEELVAFNKKVTEERNKYLQENLVNYERKLAEVDGNLKELNKKRNQILSILRETDSFTKFKRYQLDLVEIENDINHLLNKLDNLEALQDISNRKLKLEEKLDELIQEIKAHFKNSNESFKKIQSMFTKLVERIISETAIIYYKINTNDNIDFKAKITSLDEGVMTSKSDGYSYRKMLCVCFDLAILTNYHKSKFFKFVYHDGSLESLSPTKKITYLETVNSICTNYDIQYIFTSLEDDLPKDFKGEYIGIRETDIVLTLDDRENNEGRLFGFEF